MDPARLLVALGMGAARSFPNARVRSARGALRSARQRGFHLLRLRDARIERLERQRAPVDGVPRSDGTRLVGPACPSSPRRDLDSLDRAAPRRAGRNRRPGPLGDPHERGLAADVELPPQGED